MSPETDLGSTPAAAPESAAAPSSATISAGPEWTSAIPADLAKDGLWGKYAGKPLGDVLKAFHGAAAYQGRSVALPPKDAKPEDVQAWKAEHLPKLRAAGVLDAVPDAPTGYKVSRPETAADLGWDDAAEQGFLGVAHQAGLTQAQVEAVMGWYGKEFGGALVKDIATQNAAGTKALQDEWGSNFEPFLGRAERFINEHFGEERRAQFKASGLARDPEFIKEVFKLAGQHVEAGLMTGVPRVGFGPAEFQARIDGLLTQMNRLNPGSPAYEALASEYRDLHKRQYAGQAA